MKGADRYGLHGAADLHREQELGKAYDTRLIRRLWDFLHPYKRSFWGAVLCLPIVSAFSLVQPYILKLAIDTCIATGDTEGLLRLGTLYAASMLGEFLFLYLQYTLTMRVAQHTLADLRAALFSHVLRLPAKFFDRNPVGRLVTRLTTDVDVINEMFASGGLTILMDGVTLLGIIAIMLVIDFRLALVTLSLVPLVLGAIHFFRMKARKNYRRIRERIARLNTYLQEALAGMTVIQLFAREERSEEMFDEYNDAHRQANHASNIYESALFSMVEAVSSISFAVIIWYGGGQILAGALAFGTLVAFIEYIQKFFIPIRDFSTKYTVMQSAMTAAERVFQLLDTPVESQGSDRPKDTSFPQGRLEFRNVWFAYSGEDFVLRDVSFTVEPGETVAVVGPTGAGKTTLIRLLNRSYDIQKGCILVDGIDVRKWDLAALRRRIGVVLQDVFLFSGSVYENLTLGRREIEEGAVKKALRTVHADRLVARLREREDARLHERGSNLSAGERQLLSFARALAYDPAILVLDEATSSVDPETERILQDAVTKLMSGRTAIVIAHRLSTIEHADRILVFSGGRIREEGTHAELLKARGLYHRLYRLQFDRTEEKPGTSPLPEAAG